VNDLFNLIVSKEQKKIVEVISDDKPNEIEILSSEVS
jgi:hypothetical protein